MEPTYATPLIAVVEDDPRRACPLVPVLQGAGYRVAWYQDVAALLEDAMDICPDLVILASHQPQHFDRWRAARELRTLGCPVLMATACDAAAREVHLTPRGRCFVGVVRVPYDMQAVLATVADALTQYPENMHAERAVQTTFEHPASQPAYAC